MLMKNAGVTINVLERDMKYYLDAGYVVVEKEAVKKAQPVVVSDPEPFSEPKIPATHEPEKVVSKKKVIHDN